jgi:hypothetical protein
MTDSPGFAQGRAKQVSEKHSIDDVVAHHDDLLA